jgi:hypothetical protein
MSADIETMIQVVRELHKEAQMLEDLVQIIVTTSTGIRPKEYCALVMLQFNEIVKQLSALKPSQLESALDKAYFDSILVGRIKAALAGARDALATWEGIAATSGFLLGTVNAGSQFAQAIRSHSRTFGISGGS